MGKSIVDERCEEVLVRLIDEIGVLNRATGREYTLILVPQSPDEEIHISQSGKILPQNFDMSPEEILALALRRRKEERFGK